MLSRENLTKLLAILGVMLHGGIVSAASVGNAKSAKNYWVVGSYRVAATAQELTRKLESSLALPVRQQEVLVAGVLHYRLLVAEMSVDAVTAGRLNSMGITPWLMTLSESEGDRIAINPITTPIATNKAVLLTPVMGSEQYLVQVGSFSRIDEAMALERRLATAGLGVSGEAKLAAGKVVHQVWAGPSRDLSDLRNRLQEMNLVPGVVRPSSTRETSYANRSAVQPVRSDSVTTKASVQPASDRYPKDFNLARLPEKRGQALIVD